MDHRMKWFLGAAFLLLAAVVLQSGLLAYAMYVLLATLVLTRLMARASIAHISAERQCRSLVAEIGDSVDVNLTVHNGGVLPVPWVLMEDVLPSKGYVESRLRVKVKKKRAKI